METKDIQERIDALQNELNELIELVNNRKRGGYELSEDDFNSTAEALRDKLCDVECSMLSEVIDMSFMDVRIHGKYKGKGFFISSNGDWCIATDDEDVQVLVPKFVV